LLVQCLREPTTTGALTLSGACESHEAFAGFVMHARVHGVEAFAHRALRDHPDLGARDRELLHDAYHAALYVHLQARHALTEVHEAFGSRVPWLTMKGAVLAYAVYPRPDMRSYSDVDVVVPPRALADAVHALERSGATIMDRNWRRIREHMPGQIRARLRNGSVLDLHWNIVNESHLRRTFQIDTLGVFERARTVEVGDVPVLTLSRADTLVHLALHTCLSGGDRLIWLKDVEQALVHDRADTREVIDRAVSWNASLALATIVATVRRTLGAGDVDAYTTLASPAWRALVWAADRVAPVDRATGLHSAAQVLRKSVRATERTTLTHGARHVYNWVRGNALLVPQVVPSPDDDPLSALYPDGDAADRDAYLAAVASEAGG
jgi:hypothetical protein